MNSKITCFFLVFVGLHQVVFGSFASDCESGTIDFVTSFKDHIQDQFPDVTKKASMEMTSIYSYALKLVKNKAEEKDLKPIYAGISKYLQVCSDIFNFNATLSESMDKIQIVLDNMNVEERCTKDTNVLAFKEIIHSTFVNKVLTFEYFDTTFSAVVAGAARALNTLVNAALCLLKECPNGLKSIFKDAIEEIVGITTNLLTDVLEDIQAGIEAVFGIHFAKLNCNSNQGFEEQCAILDEEVNNIKRKVGRDLRKYEDCLDDKSELARKVTNFKSMKSLLRL